MANWGSNGAITEFYQQIIHIDSIEDGWKENTLLYPLMDAECSKGGAFP